jgi:hypothetical protein
MVNKVCLCFPLPFFGVPDPELLTSGAPSPSVPVIVLAASPLPALPQADATGAELEAFPLTTTFGRVKVDVGSCGNEALDISGMETWLEALGTESAPDPLLRMSVCDDTDGNWGVKRIADAELDAHGVLRWGCRKRGAGTGPGMGVIRG